MDPNATLAIMRDADADPADRHEAALNLIRWINNGGFLPSTGYGFGGNTATKFVLLGECRKVAAETAPLIFRCDECDKTFATFDEAAECHWGIGGVIEVDL